MNLRSSRRPWLAALSLGAAVTLATGCGAASDSGETVTPQEAPATELTIEVTDGATTTWTLSCDPAGGDHPDAEAACAALEARGAETLPPIEEGAVCTQQFGGDQTATVTGTWQGKSIDASFTRTNGCQISRWSALEPLLPEVV